MADRTEQVRIDLVATDQASDTIDDVAKAVDHLDETSADVEVTADTRKAAQSVSELIDNVDKLDSESATIVLAIRAAQVQRQLTDLLTDVEQLDSADPEIAVRLEQASEARADLDQLEGKIKEINGLEVAPKVDSTHVEHFAEETGKAKDTVHSFAGNAIAELPGVSDAFGPLGEAVSQMTEGVLAGEVAFGSLVSAALPIAGIAVGVMAVTRALEANKKRAKEAKEAADGWKDAYLDAVKEGADSTSVLTTKIRDLLKTHDELPAAMEEFKVSASDVADVVDGKTSPAIDTLRDFVEQVDHAIHEGSIPQLAHDLGLVDGQALVKARDRADDLLGKIDETAAANVTGKAKADQYTRAITGLGIEAKGAAPKVDDLTDSVDLATEAADRSTAAFDLMRGALDIDDEVHDLEAAIGGMAIKIGQHAEVSREEIQSIKQQVVQTGQDLKRTPLEVSTVLDMLSRGDVDSALRVVQGWADDHPIGLSLEVQRSQILDQLAALGIASGSISVRGRGAPAAGSVNVTQVFPRGFRVGSTIAEARSAARRSGGLYRRRHR